MSKIYTGLEGYRIGEMLQSEKFTMNLENFIKFMLYKLY